VPLAGSGTLPAGLDHPLYRGRNLILASAFERFLSNLGSFGPSALPLLYYSDPDTSKAADGKWPKFEDSCEKA